MDILERLLKKAGYDPNETERLVAGFKRGFDIGYRGPLERKNTAPNLPFRVGSPTELYNKVMKEVKEGRFAGPFEQLPFEHFVQSPLGLVSKSGNRTRLIFHLSYDFGGQEQDKSINFHMPRDLCTVKYKDLDHAIRNCLWLLNDFSTETVFFGKMDCSNVFHLVPVLVKQRFLLCMLAVHPKTHKKLYFINKCLAFGSSRSCAIFQAFSDALAFLAQWKIAKAQIVQNPALTNYLDDFLFLALTLWQCNKMMQVFLRICAQIACPLTSKKMEWGTSFIIFLGMLLNGKLKFISIPCEKINKATNLLQLAIDKCKVTIKFIQQLTGTLNFLNRAIVPGRAFMRGIYQKLKLVDARGRILKQHHHTYLCKLCE